MKIFLQGKHNTTNETPRGKLVYAWIFLNLFMFTFFVERFMNFLLRTSRSQIYLILTCFTLRPIFLTNNCISLSNK